MQSVSSSRYAHSRLVTTIALLGGLGLLAGCPTNSSTQSSAPPPVAEAAAFHGSVYGGRQPIAGATVLAYEMATVSDSAPTEIGNTDTDSSGNFSMTFSPTPATGQIVYLEATGGNAGSGINSAISLMTVAGPYCSGSNCAFPASVNIDELSTVVSAAAMRLYFDLEICSNINGNTQPVNDTCVTLEGDNVVSPLFAQSVAALVDLSSGQASGFLTSQASGSPIHLTLEKANSLADLLAACVNSSGPGSSGCTGLFGATLDNAGDTLTTAYDIATSPVINAEGTALFNLLPSPPVYTPVVTVAPANWTVAGNVYSYAANFGNGTSSASGSVSAWQVSTQSGVSLLPITTGGTGTCGVTPDPNNCFTAGLGTNSVVISPGGQFVYADNENSGNISAWAVDPASGVLVPVTSNAASCGSSLPGNCFTDGNSPLTLAINDADTYLYAVDGNNEISVYSIDPSTGALTPITGSPFAAGNRPQYIILDASLGFAYVSNYGGNDVSAYTVNAASGALAPVTTGGAGTCGVSPDPNNCFAAGNQPEGLSVDSSGSFLYVGDRNCASPPSCTLAGSISEWSINSSSGVLTPISALSCGSSPDPDNCVGAGIDP